MVDSNPFWKNPSAYRKEFRSLRQRSEQKKCSNRQGRSGGARLFYDKTVAKRLAKCSLYEQEGATHALSAEKKRLGSQLNNEAPKETALDQQKAA